MKNSTVQSAIKFSYLTIFFLTLLFHNISYCQITGIQWEKTYGGSAIDFGYFIAQTHDLGYIIVGSTQSSDSEVVGYHGDHDIWVIKVDPFGTLQWSRCLGGSNIEKAYNVIQAHDGGYVISAGTQSTDGDVTVNRGHGDAWIIKLDSSGSIAWQKTYGGSGADGAALVQQTVDDGYIFAGVTTSADGQVTGYHGGSGFDYWIVKLDDTGGVQWQKAYGGTQDDEASSLLVLPDGNFLISGTSFSSDGDVTINHGNADCWIIKINSTGDLIWQHSYGGSMDEGPGSLAFSSDGNYLLTNSTYSNDGDVSGYFANQDIWLMEFNDTGGILSSKCYGGDNIDYYGTSIPTRDSGFITLGGTYSTDGDVTANYGMGDIWIFKTDKIGNLIWQKNYGGDSSGLQGNIILSNDGALVFSGSTRSIDHDVATKIGTRDYWVVKLMTPDFSPLIFLNTSISIFPNPTHGVLNIILPDELENSTIKIFDINGIEQAEDKKNGIKRMIPINHLKQGTYLVKVTYANLEQNYLITVENN